jgi:hypothetical protein
MTIQTNSDVIKHIIVKITFVSLFVMAIVRMSAIQLDKNVMVMMIVGMAVMRKIAIVHALDLHVKVKMIVNV